MTCVPDELRYLMGNSEPMRKRARDEFADVCLEGCEKKTDVNGWAVANGHFIQARVLWPPF